jgi:hypothetical protein
MRKLNRTLSLSARLCLKGRSPSESRCMASALYVACMDTPVGRCCPLGERYISMYLGGQQRVSVHNWSGKPSAILRTDQSSERLALRLILSFTVRLRCTRSCASRSSRHCRGPVTVRSTPLFSDCANTTFKEHAGRHSENLTSSTFATT